VVNENGNKDSGTFSSMRDLRGGVVCKWYGLDYLLAKDVGEADEGGEIDFDDLEYHASQGLRNCCLIDGESMLPHG
ncbi:anaerobic ribonucleoside-triphosphate reductase, partial [Staphylococcus saprophyticus]|uniref:anaerobic ribonucleoside-triphosphate reductase n=1 Tax=Staphylococcus saprophyticus TaxID=29385 RepID=UPI0028CB97BA